MIAQVIKKRFLANLPLTTAFSTETTSRRTRTKEKYGDRWKSVVGLEIHAQISSASKLFSSSGTSFLMAPNTQVSFFDAALPGTLPVLNRSCVEAAVLTALALNCTVNKVSTFDRKHYFYADLPAGYQITQHRAPLASNGTLNFVLFNPSLRRGPYELHSMLKQLQLEQDSGKSLYDTSLRHNLIDLNRAGIGLMELVFEPDLQDGEEAAALVKELQLIMSDIGTCSCRMEEGAFRVDANISVNRPGEPAGVRTEVKNISSTRSIAKAIDFEIDRQIKVIEGGGSVINETRMYDAKTKGTVVMRDKEVVQDYRYMPEPNLPPLLLCDNDDRRVAEKSPHIVNIDAVKERLPVLPEANRQHLMDAYGFNLEHAYLMVNQTGLQEYFEAIMTESPSRSARKVANVLLSRVLGHLNDRNLTFSECPISPDRVGEVVDLMELGTVSSPTASDILQLLFQNDKRRPKEIVKENQWYQVTDPVVIEALCRDAMRKHPDKVRKYKNSGKMSNLDQMLKEINEASNRLVDTNAARSTLVRLLDET